jgi:hypothetical protein
MTVEGEESALNATISVQNAYKSLTSGSQLLRLHLDPGGGLIRLHPPDPISCYRREMGERREIGG